LFEISLPTECFTKMISSTAALLVLGSTLTSAVTTWDSAHEKASAALEGLTNDDKATITSGAGWMSGPCVGNTGEISSIGFPALCLQDGPLGVRYAPNVTAFPAGIHAAATWDADLINKRGVAIGEESKALGVNVQLGPASGPLGKIPTGGRNWEGFGPDPYLAGISMAQTITGMQDAGVQACAKHYIVNEQEHQRSEIDSVVDDRTMHELYLWPFSDAVKANVASVMCSYNLVNGSHTCENSPVLQDLLKGELGFQV
jgi:beta-glucosidase